MTLSFKLCVATAGAAILLALGACSNNPDAPGNQISQGAQKMGHGIAGYSTDTAITSTVKAKMAANTGLDSFDIHVDTVNGVVTLTGTVDSEATRKIAAHVARNTDGVKGVDNKLKIKTDSDDD